jgi:hypothetical protein
LPLSSSQGLEGPVDGRKRARRKGIEKPIKIGRLAVVNGFVRKSNINELIVKGGISGDIDLLSIDIDGNDYWIWQEIRCINPRVVVIEYNAKFPPSFAWVMEYDDDHVWQGDDEQGASLKALELLGKELGYQLVGTNVVGSNAFFVRTDQAGELFFAPPVSEKLYNPTRWTMEFKSGHPSKRYIGA